MRPTSPAISRRVSVALAGLAVACLAAGLLAGVPRAAAARAHAARLLAQEAALLRDDDRGLYLAFCPSDEEVGSIARAQAAGAAPEPSASGTRAAAAGAAPEPSASGPHAQAASAPRARVAMADHEGWPPDECLKMDKGGAGSSHTLVGLAHVHNWLLGGFGDDTFYAGDRGDVIWGDYHPEGQPESQRDYIHGGPGEDWIYSSHGFNEIWTGAGDDHLALVYGHGIVYCNGGGLKTLVMRYLPQNRPWTLVGCKHKKIDPYRA